MNCRRLLWITCLSATALEPACVRLGYGVIETDGADWGGIGSGLSGTTARRTLAGQSSKATIGGAAGRSSSPNQSSNAAGHDTAAAGQGGTSPADASGGTSTTNHAGNASGQGGTAAGNATGGKATGGKATGGNATGGNATGGNATGGIATGGIATGGIATGGTAIAQGGAAGAADQLSCVETPIPADATLDGAVPATCAPGALVCQDMEVLPPPETSTTISTGATLALSSCGDSVQGARSLHTVLPTRTGVSAVIYYQLPSPISTGTIYGREWIRISNVALPFWIDLVEFGYSGGKTSVEVMSDASLRFNVLVGGAFPRSAANVVPLGTWFCLTYSIQVGDAGQVTADIDGTTLIDVPVDTYDADYTNVFFGAWVNRGMTGLEVNIDDVVIGTQPIGCN